ncbi:hypothetical protein [Permianibacter fluminis]|uniref:hypothetical protein n=1 Tax=Permianibacter fluminis TaxID=2738515 RepID=UPI001F405B38|nr:hypothetical protein [Permianibacter fluminis]
MPSAISAAIDNGVAVATVRRFASSWLNVWVLPRAASVTRMTSNAPNSLFSNPAKRMAIPISQSSRFALKGFAAQIAKGSNNSAMTGRLLLMGQRQRCNSQNASSR